MEDIARKRPGRPRKVVEPAHAESEVGEPANVQLGAGEIGSARTSAEEVNPEKGQGIDWLGLMAAIHSEKAQVVRCWHPEAKHDLAQLKNGANIEVKVGNPAYQLTTGEIVSL